MTLRVSEIVGPSGIAVSGDDGQQIFNTIHPRIVAGERVVLDFSGVRVFASPFFNAAIGALLEDTRPDVLESLLISTNLTAVGEQVLRKVLSNAEQYYYRPELREALDDILKEASSEKDAG